MKHSLKQIAALTAEKLNAANSSQLAKSVWLELQRMKKFNQLDDLMSKIRSEICSRKKLKNAQIISGCELAEDEKHEIVSRVEKRTGEKILPTYRIDPGILGGIKIKVEDELIDLSWRGKLELIRTRLEGTHE